LETYSTKTWVSVYLADTWNKLADQE